MKYINHCLLALLFMLASVSSAAAQCSINVLPVNFGAFDNLINPLYANGQVSVQCTPLAPVAIQLDAGAHDDSRLQHFLLPDQVQLIFLLLPQIIRKETM